MVEAAGIEPASDRHNNLKSIGFSSYRMFL